MHRSLFFVFFFFLFAFDFIFGVASVASLEHNEWIMEFEYLFKNWSHSVSLIPSVCVCVRAFAPAQPFDNELFSISFSGWQ